MEMQRRHSWISPERVQRRMSTGSGRLSIRRAVEMWMDCICSFGLAKAGQQRAVCQRSREDGRLIKTGDSQLEIDEKRSGSNKEISGI